MVFASGSAREAAGHTPATCGCQATRMRNLQVRTNELPNYLGLDGFRFGWVAAWIDERGGHGFDYSPGLMRLLAIPHARAMIDMPIGLNAEGYRCCDKQARKLVGAAV